MSGELKTEHMAISFLKELDKAVADILNESGQIVLLVEQLYRTYNDWIDINPDVSRSESFMNLGKDIKSLAQTCRFLSNDCLDVRHSISDCDIELN